MSSTTSDIATNGVGDLRISQTTVERRVRTGAAGHLLRSERARRTLNVAVALLGIVLAAPLMLLLAVLVRITSAGPFLYTQPRVGLDRRSGGSRTAEDRREQDLGGRPFTIYKFRTMREGLDDSQVWASPDDPRVTDMGRILRRLRLDELPQLVNVLKGDMNVVGPRPEQPRIFAELRQGIPHYHRRQRVLPGITGWAQVNHHYDQHLDDVACKVELDLDYLTRLSITQDLKIMARTVPVMLRGEGGW